jgi:hypothetical protein
MSRQGFSVQVCRGLVLLLTIAGASAAAAHAGVDSWTPFGPTQGRLFAVAASSRGDLFALAAFGELAEAWQLPAGEATWRWRSSGFGRPRVRAIAVHPRQPDWLWAVTGETAPGVFRSFDAGVSWLLVAPGPPGFHVTGLWVAPHGSSPILFAETGGDVTRRLLRSGDGGLTWAEVPGALGPVAIAPDKPTLVFAAAASGGGVLRSVDGGRSFRPTRPVAVATGDELRVLHATRGRRPLVFASFRFGGLFRSVDGERWQYVGFGGYGPSALASDPHDERRVYAAEGNGFYSSTRSGRAKSFRLTAPVLPLGSIPEPTAMVVGAGGPVLLAGGNLRDSRLQVLAETGIMAFGVAEVTMAEEPASELAARVYLECTAQCDVRTFLSHDAGATFSLLAFQVLPRLRIYVTDLAFDPAFGWRRLETSPVGTNLWQPVRPIQVLPYPVDAVAIAAEVSLLAGGTQGVLRREGEAGSWETTLANVTAAGSLRAIDLRVDPGAPDGVVALALETAAGDPPPPPKLLAFRSLDAGRHWSPVLPALAGLLDVEPVPGAPMSLFALVAVAGGSELRRSDDGGMTSSLVHTFATAEGVSEIAVDAVAPDVLYAASANGLLRSRDAGATWASTPGTLYAWGLYRQRLQRLWVHPTERGHVFAAPADGGLFENRLSD